MKVEIVSLLFLRNKPVLQLGICTPLEINSKSTYVSVSVTVSNLAHEKVSLSSGITDCTQLSAKNISWRA